MRFLLGHTQVGSPAHAPRKSCQTRRATRGRYRIAGRLPYFDAGLGPQRYLRFRNSKTDTGAAYFFRRWEAVSV